MPERFSEQEPGEEAVDLTTELDEEAEVERFDINEENDLLKKQAEEKKKKKAA